MIKMTALTGPHAGKTNKVPADVNPSELLNQFASEDWKWKLDFTQASEQELLEWGQANLIARVLASILHGRSVWLQGVEYRVKNPEEASLIVDEVEKAIEYSGVMFIKITSDDENGVVIGTVGTEYPVQ